MILRVLGITIAGLSLGIFNSLIRIPVIQLSPDIAMLFLSIIVARSSDSLLGILSGFLIGTGLDLMSLAPLGFYASIFCLIGYVTSQLYTLFYFGKLLLATIMGMSATFLKYLLSWIISGIFPMSYGKAEDIFSSRFLWELLINTVISPFLFICFDFFSRILADARRRGVS